VEQGFALVPYTDRAYGHFPGRHGEPLHPFDRLESTVADLLAQTSTPRGLATRDGRRRVALPRRFDNPAVTLALIPLTSGHDVELTHLEIFSTYGGTPEGYTERAAERSITIVPSGDNGCAPESYTIARTYQAAL
jgi:hypothetical protein